MTDDGWTKSYRRLWKHPVFRNFRDAAVWSYMIDNAAWRDNQDVWFRGRRIMLMEGQIVTSERELAEGFCCDRQVIRRILDALEKNLMISRHKTADYTIVTICNYREYQAPQEEQKPTGNPPISQDEPTENPPYIDKNSKNSKTDDDDAPAIEREHIVVTRKILAIMGTDFDDRRFFGSMARVEMWIKQGWSPENLIIPAVERMMLRRAGQGPPNGISYVEKAIQSFANELSRPLPEITNVNGTRSQSRQSGPSLDDQFRELDRLGSGFSGSVESFADAAGGDVIDHVAVSH